MSAPPLVDIHFTLNGERHSATVTTNAMLVDVLRDTFGLKGCKVACDAAVCGACTVLLDEIPVAACSTFAFEAEGAAITTIEGLGSASELDVLQRVFLQRDAFQCGFCTAGMILTTKALLRAHADPDEATIRSWLGGNLCRCTGYQMIVEAVQRAAVLFRNQDA